MPVPKIDWTELKTRALDRSGLFALTQRQADLLLSMSEVLTWESTFRTAGYDFADYDTLQAEIADAQRGLIMPVYLDDFMDRLDVMTEAILSLYCCETSPVDVTDGGQYTDHIIEDLEDGVPQNVVDAGYATDIDDWPGYYDYKCMISYIAVDELAFKLVKFEELATSGGAALGVIAAILGTVVGIIAGTPFLIVAGIVAGVGLVAAFYDELAESEADRFTDAAEDVLTYKTELACAMFAGDGPAGSYVNLIAKADELLDIDTRLLVRLMNMQADLKLLYSGRYDEVDVAQKLADLGYDIGPFDCASCDFEDPPTGYQLLHPPEDDFVYLNLTTAPDGGSSYDEVSGLLILRANVTDGAAPSWAAKFDTLAGDWGHKSNHHGFVMKFLEYTKPVSSGVFNMMEPPSAKHYPNVITSGEFWAGYNTSRHSGAAWNDWVNQYDEIDLYDDGDTNNQQDPRLVVTSAPNPTGIYEIQVLLWLVTPV